MRILLTANASYVPPRGGATRSNLVWLDHLAAAGHSCRVVCATLGDSAGRLEQLRGEGIEQPVDLGGGVEFSRRGERLEIYAAAEPARQLQLLRRQVEEFEPDWLLVSSEDVGHVLLRAAHQLLPGRVVYLAHTPQFFPFGPASWNPEPQGAEMVARAAGVVVLGRHMQAYVEKHAGCRAEIIHPPIYGTGPFRQCGSFDNEFVTLINPCQMKGITIFLALAERFPQVRFAALPGWGTTTADRQALEALPNVVILPNCRDIEEVLARTRVLLMPSLWYEGFGLIVMEAMLRGVPVVASDFGGLQEAKAGTGFVIPVRPIERLEPVFDERGLPKPVLAEQDITPWAEALQTLLSDRAAYEREAAASREAALRFVCGIRPERMEEFLKTLVPASKEPEEDRRKTAREILAGLSPEKRALLLQRLRKQTPSPK
ncbi:MAG TPA: glycosyltransferase family 4 protein [Bryobacteraceae bacterium]|nr:glycosyltransferase family 4 protein [Bryobacteraceae bacterium]HOQ45321.1 glycosyltransferase family 4 protein [Bryobacteraceae bacterium]HPQ16392.1 glycosyltransferase family 4 protein [Bryobacteraceae bacterium]HPU71368.1 glycosyltransferase family 4 protein [Bryobacteraceae bacterium]